MWLLWGLEKLSLSRITAAREVDSKVISLSFSIFSDCYLRVGLDQRLSETSQDSVLLMDPEK